MRLWDRKAAPDAEWEAMEEACVSEKVKQLCTLVYFGSCVLIEISLSLCIWTGLTRIKKNCGYLKRTYVPGIVIYINYLV